MKTTLHLEFERLARHFLAAHPGVQHEWSDVREWHGERTDLICGIGQPNEVFASLKGGQIAVGITSGQHDDFEDFGRRATDADVAREAFARFLALLREHGHLSGADQ